MPKFRVGGENVSVGEAAGFTVRVKFCTALGETPFAAVKVRL